MKIAIVSCFFSESTLALCKYLALNECEIHYYYITNKKRENAAGFDFKSASKKLGLIKLDRNDSPDIYNYFRGLNVHLNLIRVFSLAIEEFRFKVLNRFVEYIVIKKIKKENFDVINFVGGTDLFIYYHKKLRKIKRFHTIHEVNNHFDNEIVSESNLFDYLFKKSIPIILHSKVSYDRMMLYPNCRKDIVNQIPFSLFETFSLFDEKDVSVNLDDNLKVVLFFGIIKPYKGLNVLIKAFEQIKESLADAVLVIAGKGDIPNKEIIDGCDKYVVINRELSNEEIVYLNKKATIVVCPYLSASQSGIVMTSFLYNNPVIATKVGAFVEVIDNGVNGILVEPNNVEQLADAIKISLTNEELFIKMKQGVAEYTTTEYTNWDSIAKKTLALYQLNKNNGI